MPKTGKKFRPPSRRSRLDRIRCRMRSSSSGTCASRSSTSPSTSRCCSAWIPKHADQMVRGTVVLPHGTGKSKRVAVIASERRRSGKRRRPVPTIVGGEDLVEKIAGRVLEFEARRRDAGHDARWSDGSERCSGPRGLMPNPKAGTVTPDVAQGGPGDQGRQDRVPRRQDLDHPRADREDLVRREEAARRTPTALINAVLKAKPAAAKGKYFRAVSRLLDDGAGSRDRHRRRSRPRRRERR